MTGTYTGNGTSQTINTGLSGIDFLLVKGGANVAVAKTSGMAADAVKQMNAASAVATGRVTAISGGSFDVGSNAQTNANGTAYFWLAVKAAAADCKVGSYTGTAATLGVTGVGFQPDLVIILGAGSRIPYFKTATMGSNNSTSFVATSTLLTTRFTSLDADGFTLSSNSDVNATGETFYYAAFKEQAARFDVFTYTGNGADDRAITVAVDPAFALVDGSTATAATASAIRFEDEVGDLSFQIDATTSAANKIQAFGTASLTVGTDVSVNENATAYHGFAFDEGTDGGGASAAARLLLLGVG